jgi:putative phosphoribosyl transferase
MVRSKNTVREESPAKLIAAVAVLPVSPLKEIRKYADEAVYLDTPENFVAVGQYFEDFAQVTDERVVTILEPVMAGEESKEKIVA